MLSINYLAVWSLSIFTGLLYRVSTRLYCYEICAIPDSFLGEHMLINPYEIGPKGQAKTAYAKKCVELSFALS